MIHCNMPTWILGIESVKRRRQFFVLQRPLFSLSLQLLSLGNLVRGRIGIRPPAHLYFQIREKSSRSHLLRRYHHRHCELQEMEMWLNNTQHIEYQHLAVLKTTMLTPQHGYLQHLDLTSDFDWCFSSVYCDWCYPLHLILDARKRRLGCQCCLKLEKTSAYGCVGCLLRRKYYLALRNRMMTPIVHV